jgi:hypothetical protein
MQGIVKDAQRISNSDPILQPTSSKLRFVLPQGQDRRTNSIVQAEGTSKSSAAAR